MQKCGLCSMLARLLRRAMCVSSRRGSGESYYQELAETNVPNAATMETTDSSVYIRLIPNENSMTRRRMSDTDKDRPLLESLMVDDRLEYPRRRHACTGRFLTMHKRRRKKLTTRGLQQDPAILDDVLHGQVQCILNQVDNWRFNAFTLETVTGGRSLPVLCVHLFHVYGLMEQFQLDVVRLWKLFSLIEEGYHSTNPYHNSIHATDVTQAMHCFLQESTILEHMQPIEIMASLLGAVTHDLDHPGVNQPFLIATSNHLAALYENTSVLENHHWRSAVGCLLESGVAEQIHAIRPQLEEQISSLILATDITRQAEFLAQFRRYLDTGTLDMRRADHRHFILQIALKSADISNPCRPWDVSKKWSQKVCEEFFRQGDYERQLNLPVTSLCDRYTTSVPKIQVGFFKFVVTPLFDEWHRFLSSPLSRRMMRYLKYNQVQWESKVAAELAEETRTEISDTEVLAVEDVDDLEVSAGSAGEEAAAAAAEAEALELVVDDDEDDEMLDDIDGVGSGRHALSDSSEVLLPDVQRPKVPRRSSLQIPAIVMSRFDRRHSVPVNPLPKIILPKRENRSRDAIREERIEAHSNELALQLQLQQQHQLQQQQQRFDTDTFSLLSSESDSYRRSGGGGGAGGLGRSSEHSDSNRQHQLYHQQSLHERPLSAETLVPDLSIATMSECADRLNVVMHGAPITSSASASNKLIRQQTFPPVQPYVRARYLSAAADMGACNEISSGSTSGSPSEMDVAVAAARTASQPAADAGIFIMPMSQSHSSASCGASAGKREAKVKREQSDSFVCGIGGSGGGEKTASKMAKLSVDLGHPAAGQKENVDPSIFRRVSARRRGSAPVIIALPTASASGDERHDEIFKTCDRFGRRGSMPAEVVHNFFTDSAKTDPCSTSSSFVTDMPTTPSLAASMATSQSGSAVGAPSFHSFVSADQPQHHQHHHQQQHLPNIYRANIQLIPRRGSMPCESLSAVFGTRSSNNNNNNHGGSSKQSRQNSRKKLLRRRSAGGNADILAPIFGDALDDDDDHDHHQHHLAETDEATSRRGSALAIAAAAAAAVATDAGIVDEGMLLGASDAAAASMANSARYRLKRGSEVVVALPRNNSCGGGGGGGGGAGNQQQQRSEMEAMLSRRRGSLPVEMLSISCSGNIRH